MWVRLPFFPLFFFLFVFIFLSFFSFSLSIITSLAFSLYSISVSLYCCVIPAVAPCMRPYPHTITPAADAVLWCLSRSHCECSTRFKSQDSVKEAFFVWPDTWELKKGRTARNESSVALTVSHCYDGLLQPFLRVSQHSLGDVTPSKGWYPNAAVQYCPNLPVAHLWVITPDTSGVIIKTEVVIKKIKLVNNSNDLTELKLNSSASSGH